jgi:predicted TIM-barrel fold metal-dependent hydrolase
LRGDIYQDFDPEPSPCRKLPEGAIDCHFHVFEDPEAYPFTSHRSYTPSSAPWAAYENMMKSLGVDRAVLVHPSVYGHDHRILLDGLRSHADRLRGVAVISPDTSEKEIEELHQAGVRGTRINIVAKGGSSLVDAEKIVKKISHYGWHIQFLVDISVHKDVPAWAVSLGVPVVFDHFGHPSNPSPQHPGFKNLCAALKEGLAWIKLSAPYRVCSAENRWAKALPLVDAILETRVDRVVWGSDWPHPFINQPMPNDGMLGNLVFEWLPEDALRRQVLVENPEVLYDFSIHKKA